VKEKKGKEQHIVCWKEEQSTTAIRSRWRHFSRCDVGKKTKQQQSTQLQAGNKIVNEPASLTDPPLTSATGNGGSHIPSSLGPHQREEEQQRQTYLDSSGCAVPHSVLVWWECREKIQSAQFTVIKKAHSFIVLNAFHVV